MGPKPFVMIFDKDIAKDTFGRNEFAGRPDSYFGKTKQKLLNNIKLF